MPTNLSLGSDLSAPPRMVPAVGWAPTRGSLHGDLRGGSPAAALVSPRSGVVRAAVGEPWNTRRRPFRPPASAAIVGCLYEEAARGFPALQGVDAEQPIA